MRTFWLSLLCLLWVAPQVDANEAPIKFENEIVAFEQQDKVSPPLSKGLLMVGSSTIRLWSKTSSTDFAPYPVINRGFGGAITGDIVKVAHRIATPHRPRVVIYCCGGNDLFYLPMTPEQVFENIKTFVGLMRKEDPQVRFVFLAILKVPSRLSITQSTDTLNQLLKKYSEENPGMYFVDHNPLFTQADGSKRLDLMLDDHLHANDQGYREIVQLIRPVVDQAWGDSAKNLSTP
jgi:lysophospholipase L1-like esterase